MNRSVAVWKRSWLPGSETFIRNQMEALSSWRATAIGVSRTAGGLVSADDQILFNSSLRDWMALRVFTLTGRSARISSAIRSSQAEVIHAHFAPEAIKIYRLCRYLNLPLIVTVHGHDVTAAAELKGLRGRLYRARARRMFKSVAHVIAVSEFIRERAIALGAAPERTVVQHIGIPLFPRVQYQRPARWDVVFVGRLVEKKGVQDLLEALHRIETRGAAASALIIGSGPLESQLREFAQSRGLNVEFAGHLSPPEVRDALSSARVFAGPSRTASNGDAEGFGLVFLEAASCGLPVVAYRHGGVSEAVLDGETGILCDEGDVWALAVALERLLVDDPLRRELGQNGRRRVEEQFDILVRTRALERVYEEAVARNSRA